MNKRIVIAVSAILVSPIVIYSSFNNKHADVSATLELTRKENNSKSNELNKGKAESKSSLHEKQISVVATHGASKPQNKILSTNAADSINEAIVDAQDFHLDNLVSEDDTHVVFNGSLISTLNTVDSRHLISKLSYELTSYDASEKLSKIRDALNTYTSENRNIVIDSVECSDKVCGILVSSALKTEINSALNKIRVTPEIKSTLNGGSLRVFEEDGYYYGLVISSIGDKPVKLVN